MNSVRPDSDYYRHLRRQADGFRLDLDKDGWCDLWHTHLDWEGFGDLGWVHRRRHVNALLRALVRARREMAAFSGPYQLFAVVNLGNSADDAIFVHTPNPNGTEFPRTFPEAVLITELPPLLAGRINLSRYSVLKQKYGGKVSYVIQPRV